MTEKGFEKADSLNLPHVNAVMVATYFSNSLSHVSAKVRGVKRDRSGRNSYGDDAIGYVQVKREPGKCIVKARVTPEHKVRSKCYTVLLTIDSEEDCIEIAMCLDCAASSGGCKHAVTLIFWVHRRSEEPSPTETTCYWKKSRLSLVGTTIKTVKSSDLCSRGRTNKSDIAANTGPAGSFLMQVIKKANELQTDSQLIKHFNPLTDVESLSINNLAYLFQAKGGGSADDFFKFCKPFFTESACKQAASDTSAQASSSMWH